MHVDMHAWFAKRRVKVVLLFPPSEKGGMFYLPTAALMDRKDFLLPGTGKHIVGFRAA